MALIILNLILIPIVIALSVFLFVMKRKMKKFEEEKQLMQPVEKLEAGEEAKEGEENGELK